jgi:cytochrome c oxidase subunit 2
MYGTTSTLTERVDQLFYFIIGSSLVLLLLVTTLMIVFAVRYRRSRRPQVEPVAGRAWLELTWTLVPLALVMVMFFVGYNDFRAMRAVPADAMPVKVIGRMWQWSFQYENGKETRRLYVPLDRPIKLNLTSVDVIHSFFIPAFRIKEDAVPGRQNYLWFKPQTVGPADVFCAEYCGQSHSYMMSAVIVMTPEEFRAWYDSPAEEAAIGVVGVLGERGCLDCHSLDGTVGQGPTFRGLYGSPRTVVARGVTRRVIADEDYLRRAILAPRAEIVQGFGAGMSVPDSLSQQDLGAILDVLKGLK